MRFLTLIVEPFISVSIENQYQYKKIYLNICNNIIMTSYMQMIMVVIDVRSAKNLSYTSFSLFIKNTPPLILSSLYFPKLSDIFFSHQYRI